MKSSGIQFAEFWNLGYLNSETQSLCIYRDRNRTRTPRNQKVSDTVYGYHVAVTRLLCQQNCTQSYQDLDCYPKCIYYGVSFTEHSGITSK